MANLSRKLIERNPNLIYLLDRESLIAFGEVCATQLEIIAVIGDAGKLYVAPDVIPVYRSMLPYSTIITPNWFEVEYVYIHFHLLNKAI